MIAKLVWLAGAGALGTLARYTLAGFVQRLTGATFPWGTIAVNIFGCFVAGILWSVFEKRGVTGGVPRTAILVGFMGAFTTFSTMILETHQLVGTASIVRAAANISLQNGAGIAALIGGLTLGRII